MKKNELTEILKVIGCNNINELNSTGNRLIYELVYKMREYCIYVSNSEIEKKCDVLLKKIEKNIKAVSNLDVVRIDQF